MAEAYENLQGATGRARLFRPRRYDANEIFSGAAPLLWFDEEKFELRNISPQGVGAIARASDETNSYSAPGESGVLRLTQCGRDLFRAVARKVRAHQDEGELVAGFALTSDVFDLHALMRRNAGLLAVNLPSRETAIEPSAAYKCFCADMAAFLGGYLRRIDSHIAPIEEKLSVKDQNALAIDLSKAAEREWVELLHQANALVIPAHEDKRSRIALKSYTEKIITQILIEGPGWARCYYKPAGYPGDFRIMNYGYENRPEGESVRAKFLHLLGMISSRGIPARMETLSELICAYAADHQGANRKTPYAITSVGSGPAREIEEVLKHSSLDARWEATLIDQDEQALDYAFGEIAKLNAGDRLGVTGLNISFRDMLSPTRQSATYIDADIIYSSGFVDYLSPLLARRFIKALYDFVRPGGQVIVGNVNNLSTGMIWALEYVTDWSLYFRDESAMRDMANGIPGAKIDVTSDPTNGVYFLRVEKPA
ncbi:MAG: class I SAM-dependent methyltransferase [Pseudomonadota bacterium]